MTLAKRCCSKTRSPGPRFARAGRRVASFARFPKRRWAVHAAVIIILALAFTVRAVAYVEAPRPFEGAGLAAEQAEMARNVVDHGKWFSLNEQAYALVKKRQAQEQRLVDLSRVDFSHVDREARPVPVVDQMPGVSVVLVGLWWLSGNKTYSSIQWLQILLDTAMVFLVYWIGMRLTQRSSVALVAALLYAVWPKAIIFAKRPLLDTWSSFFTITCVAAFIWARERPTSMRRLALLGLLTGLGIYFRPFIVFLPITLALVATPGGGWKRRLLWMSAPTAVALLVLAPWTVRNYYEFHRFIPTRTGLGQAVFEGTGQASSDERAQDYVRRHRKHTRYGSPGYDQVLLQAAKQGILDRPVAYLRGVAHRARRLVPCLLLLLVWRRWRIAGLILVTVAATTIIPYSLIGDDGRFYLPMFFAYFVLIAMVADVMLTFTFRSRFASEAETRSATEVGRR
jgi:Dolichyl-phosphate-mannose-protein mannosyltransferase